MHHGDAGLPQRVFLGEFRVDLQVVWDPLTAVRFPRVPESFGLDPIVLFPDPIVAVHYRLKRSTISIPRSIRIVFERNALFQRRVVVRNRCTATLSNATWLRLPAAVI